VEFSKIQHVPEVSCASATNKLVEFSLVVAGEPILDLSSLKDIVDGVGSAVAAIVPVPRKHSRLQNYA